MNYITRSTKYSIYAIVVLIISILFFSFMTQKAYAVDVIASGECGDNATWELTGANTNMVLTVSGNGAMDDYTDVNDIPWYSERQNIVKVVIEPGITHIGRGAFNYCKNLDSITISEGVTSIGEKAFSACSSLTSITIPDSVTSMGAFAFVKCTSLKNVTIGNSLKRIEEGTFLSCSSLTSITIPDSVTSIGVQAFSSCSGLTSITIPDSVTSIEVSAFNSCSSLTEITIPSSVNNISSGTFGFCSNLEEITIPNSVTSIGEYAFRSCSSLTKITIPDSVTSIGEWAFYSCSSLTEITIPDSVTSMGTFVFGKCISLKKATIGNSLKRIEEYAFEECSSLAEITISEGVTSIGNCAFECCSSLTEIMIPSSVISIECKFGDCINMTSIDVAKSNTSYCSYDGCLYNKEMTEFVNCPGAKTSIIIPEGVTSIGEGAFDWCGNLTSITIPEGIISIGAFAFEKCDRLTSITIPDTVESIGAYAFDNCSGLIAIAIPEGVTSIGEYTFNCCSSLASISIPEGVTSIGEGAFYDCNNLSDVYYGGTERHWNEVSIGFDNDALTSANIHYGSQSSESGEDTDDTNEISGILRKGEDYSINWSVKYYLTGTKRANLKISLNGSAKDYDGSLSLYDDNDTENGGTSMPWLAEEYGLEKSDFKEITISGNESNSVALIPDQFKDYNNIKTVYLTNVDEIGSGAFENCASLKSVSGFGEDLHSIGDRAFKNCTSLSETIQARNIWEGWCLVRYYYYPKNLRKIGDEAFYNTPIEYMYLYDSVCDIGDNAFGECSNLTIHCNKGSYALQYAEDNNIPYIYMTGVTQLDSFDVNVDAWSFVNNYDAFGHDAHYYIHYTDMAKYTNTQREIVKKARMKEWSGSCFGMSSLAVLVKMGAILPQSIQEEKYCLYDISAPNNDEVESLINFFHFQQYFRPYASKAASFMKLSDEKKLQTIQSYAEKAMEGEQPFLLTYFYPEDEDGIKLGHAVVGFGVEHGDYQVSKPGSLFEKIEYDSRILLYNCNYPGEIQYLYYNEGTNNWLFPFAKNVAEIGSAVRDRTVLDAAEAGIEEDHFFKTVIHMSDDPSFTLSSQGNSYGITEPGIYGDDAIAVYAPVNETTDGSQESDTLIAVVPDDASFSVTPVDSNAGILMSESDDKLISIDCDNFNKADFTEDGTVMLSGVTGDCSLKFVSNAPSETLGWSTAEFSGNDINGDISARENSEGVILSGSGINGLIINLSDEETSTSFSFDTDESSVLIAGTLGDVKLYTDPDHDGEYDNDLALEMIEQPSDDELVHIDSLPLSGLENKTYTGKTITQNIIIKDNEQVLKEGSDYRLSYENNVNVGVSTVTIQGIGRYTGTVTKTFTISKATNTLSVKGKKATLKYSKLKKRNQTLACSQVITFTDKGQGTPSYTLYSAKKGSKNFKKYFSVNVKTGELKVKKKLKKGTYTIKVNVTAAGNNNYNAAATTVTVKVKVK